MIYLELKQRWTILLRRIIILSLLLIVAMIPSWLNLFKPMGESATIMWQHISPFLGLYNGETLLDVGILTAVLSMIIEFYLFYIATMDIWNFHKKIIENGSIKIFSGQLYGSKFFVLTEYIINVISFLIIWVVYKSVLIFLLSGKVEILNVLLLGLFFYLAVMAISLLSTVAFSRSNVSPEYLTLIVFVLFVIGNIYKIFPIIKFAIASKGEIVSSKINLIHEKLEALKSFTIISYQNILVSKTTTQVVVFSLICVVVAVSCVITAMFLYEKKANKY